jgi:hypothetical protein
MRRRAIVQAYLDESGERSHAPVLVLAGFIAPYTATEKRQIYNFPWKARRQIPGVQFHYDEKTQLKIREELISKFGV